MGRPSSKWLLAPRDSEGYSLWTREALSPEFQGNPTAIVLLTVLNFYHMWCKIVQLTPVVSDNHGILVHFVFPIYRLTLQFWGFPSQVKKLPCASGQFFGRPNWARIFKQFLSRTESVEIPKLAVLMGRSSTHGGFSYVWDVSYLGSSSLWIIFLGEWTWSELSWYEHTVTIVLMHIHVGVLSCSDRTCLPVCLFLVGCLVWFCLLVC